MLVDYSHIDLLSFKRAETLNKNVRMPYYPKAFPQFQAVKKGWILHSSAA